MAPAIKPETVVQRGRELGLDLIGFAAAASLESRVPEPYRPSRIAAHMKTLVVVAKRSYAGFVVAHHGGTKQFWGGRIIKRLDETCLKLAAFIEGFGASAFPASSLMVDIAERDGLDLCPAGQGSPLLKAGAVEAGLGTLGLNLMLLTPEFGPRVYLGGVLTDAEIAAGRPLTKELCLGLEECGRCAAVCPEDAIPRRARRGADLEKVRGLDAAACARSSQPLGPRRFKQHLADILSKRDDKEEMWSEIGSRLTGAFWQEMLMIKEGAFTGCSACVGACPVGADYRQLSERQPGLSFEVNKSVTADTVEIENAGKRR
jgi:ferredoxin